MSDDYSRMTEPQVSYVRALQKRLRLTDQMLDDYCGTEFAGCEFDRLSRHQVSQLIDELKGWDGLPAWLLKTAGQQELPGLVGV